MANCPREVISNSSAGKMPPPVNTAFLIPRIIGMPKAPTDPWKQTYKTPFMPKILAKVGTKKFITIPKDELERPKVVEFKFGSTA